MGVLRCDFVYVKCGMFHLIVEAVKLKLMRLMMLIAGDGETKNASSSTAEVPFKSWTRTHPRFAAAAIS